MSYFSIKNFIEDGRKSLKEKYYWSALSVALSLPSMCSRIEFKDKTEYKRDDGTWRDKKCYEDFCKILFQNDSFIKNILGDKYYEVLYILRCDIAHAGVANIYNDNKKIFLTYNSNTSLSDYWIICIKDICESIFKECDAWLMNNKIRECRQTRFFDTEHEDDDRLLLERLRENDRKDFLEEKFNKEMEEANNNEN